MNKQRDKDSLNSNKERLWPFEALRYIATKIFFKRKNNNFVDFNKEKENKEAYFYDLP